MQNIDFYTKKEIDSKFSPTWAGTYQEYENLTTHDYLTLYTTIDTNGNVRQFLGNIEIKSGTGTAGNTIGVASGGVTMGNAGNAEIVAGGN